MNSSEYQPTKKAAEHQRDFTPNQSNKKRAKQLKFFSDKIRGLGNAASLLKLIRKE